GSARRGGDRGGAAGDPVRAPGSELAGGGRGRSGGARAGRRVEPHAQRLRDARRGAEAAAVAARSRGRIGAGDGDPRLSWSGLPDRIYTAAEVDAAIEALQEP